MKLLVTLCTLVFLFSCNKSNKDPEPYIVVKIQKDLTDTTTTTWYGVTLRNAEHKYYFFSTNKADENEIDDTIMIGRNEMGDYIILGDNISNFKIEDMRPVPPSEVDKKSN